MVIYDRGQLGQAANKSGFVRDTFEKVLRLKEILVYLNADEYLHEHLALKGGAAINMTIFDLPRLSVDLDLDFTPNLSLEDMGTARERITELLKKYMQEEGYALSDSSRYSHSLDSMPDMFMELLQHRNEATAWKKSYTCFWVPYVTAILQKSGQWNRGSIITYTQDIQE